MDGCIWRPAVLITLAFVGIIPAAGIAQEIDEAEEVIVGEDGIEDVADDLDRLLDLAEQDISQLSRVNVGSGALATEVSTVSRQASTVGKSPAAVFVISNEMIRRSGARSVPEALRMAPGVNVARIDSNKWAISIRGFNGRFANKLLVQIDGRTVYTPLFGGVFWDAQDMLLEDVERIEVIRGPGATVWGANAVNGIINVITKNARDTQGAYAEAGGGTYEREFASARYGGQLGDNAYYRVYGKWFERDEGGGPFAADDWQMGRGGFRIDWEPSCCDRVTVQGDIYEGYTGRHNHYPDPDPLPPSPFRAHYNDTAHVAGGNGLFRWTRSLGEESDWSFQAYYDRTERSYQAVPFREFRDTVDVDFQYRFPIGRDHKVICGASYRNTRDNIRDVPFVLDFDPDRRADDLFSYFIQDEIDLYCERLFLTVGSKFQHNDYTGFEIQPTARLLWLPDERHSVWASVSRAVRTPTRADDGVTITLQNEMGVFPRISGSRAFESETLIAYEAGIHAQATEKFSWDLALFYYDYDNMTSQVVGAPELEFFPPPIPPAVIVPATLANGGSAQSYGFEIFANYEVNPCWHLYGTYSFLRTVTRNTAGEGDSPDNQIYLQSSWDFCCDWQFDAIWRYVDHLPNQNVPSYNTMDLRLAWEPRCNMEVAIVGRNLLDPTHLEFGFDDFTGTVNTQVRREVYGMVSWRD